MTGGVPFMSVEEAFFCMVERQKVVAEGGRPAPRYIERRGSGLDVQIVIEKLYRNGRLTMEHIRVLRHYGRRMLRPDHRIKKEQKAAGLWSEAMVIIGEALTRKGLVEVPSPFIGGARFSNRS